ncbi:mitochondrial distribution and morphology proteins-domain-containing protein [Kockovaella imperatae]|uniref:Mitochondrial distribution and morphology proteins-domain-containing protein n=1 Tax=Kockovaella imperatae TaxID=4999 RepID=A0A1Y1UAX0_9TREE|nr:mitochondrial distribution and morphology proteins-domain-containing protein [Kockovaella imperatae]ORX34656.1 mitochondrial distribution and morphology proteins-domain-containing protein [Kockovaella imperatae]
MALYKPLRSLHLPSCSSRLATSSSSSSASSSSRVTLHDPRVVRYIAIHTFFTRQASTLSSSHQSTNVRLLRRVPPIRCRANSTATTPPSKPCPDCPKAETRGHAQEYTPFIQRLIHRTQTLTPNSPHRPTKEELLTAARTRWERFRIRLQWFFIRGWRRFNTDDLSAFASWFVVGNTIWILIGTTTFVSAVFATLNSLSLQKYVARWISDYLTSETGVNVVFESAIVPRWGASTICFSNVYVSRRPKDDVPKSDSTDFSHSSSPSASSSTSSSSSSPSSSPSSHLPAPIPFLSSSLSPETYFSPPAAESDNYTMFDVNIDEVEVTLSFMRWLDGKGLVKDAKVKGVRGVVDRRSVWWDMSKPLLPEDFRHSTLPGDFELESMSIEDALVTIYQPGGQRPYNISVFSAMIGPLRKRWLFYDLMSAEGITGQFDNCLFSLHMPQKLGKTHTGEGEVVKRMARFRVDGLPIEHAQYATGHTGPMSWITSGKLDAVLDIKFPHHPDDEVDFRALFDQIGRNVATIKQGAHPAERLQVSTSSSSSSSSSTSAINPGQHRLARPALRAPNAGKEAFDQELHKRQVTVDIDLRFRDLKAAVPIFTSDLSVTNQALIRPIVAFIKLTSRCSANRTLVPIHCQVAADLSDFDGSWTLTFLLTAGLMTSISDQIYSALAHHVSSESANSKRIRQVSFWGLQRGAEVLLDTLRRAMDPVHGQLATI